MRKNSTQTRRPGAQAAVVLMALALLAIVLGTMLWHRHIVEADAESENAAAQARIDEKAARFRTSQFELSESQRAEVPPPRAGGDLPEAPRDAMIFHLRNCRTSLEVLASGRRVLAMDLSPQGVDVVQEASSAPDRYMRVSCQWTDGGYALSDVGRMVVPPLVGEPRAFPAALLPPDAFDPDWITERSAALAWRAGRADLKRLELSYVHGQGVLLRARFDGEDVIAGVDDTPRPPGTPFPQVERMRDIDDASAQRGYRDLGQQLWTLGTAETIDRLRTRYFEPDDRFVALHILRARVDAFLSGAEGTAPGRVEIDEYGDRGPPTFDESAPAPCASAFTLAQARTLLDEAIAARGESLAEFEALTFDSAVLDCSRGGARWSFSPAAP